MANYDVDIEIALRGAEKIRNLQTDLKSVTRQVGRVNAATIKLGRALDKNFSRSSIENVNNYSNAVRRAERALRNAAAGTDAEKRAVSALVTAQKEYNAQIDRQNKLLEEERRIQGVPTRGKGPATSASTGSDRVSIRSPLASPVFGARNIAGSPMANTFGFQEGGGSKAKGITRKDRIEAAISAGAFPLLFGGGVGMSAGGAIGGFAAGATFGPAAIALQVLGGAIDDAAEKQKQLGMALKEGKGVVTAYEAAVTRLSSSKRDYLNNLEQSGQKQKLFQETVKQAEEDLGFMGKVLIANAKNAGTFDRAISILTNSLKALAVAAATPAFLQATPQAPQNNQQDALTQAAKDRVNAVREEAQTLGLTLQTKQKQFALEKKLNESNIENLAASQTAEIVEERRAAIAQARSDEMKGLITESERDEQITIAHTQAERKLLDVEKQRTDNMERLRQKREQIARDAMRAAAENARFDATKAQESLQAFKLGEQLRGQINLQIIDEQVKRTAVVKGEEAALQQALDLSDQRLGAEQKLLALENASIKVALTGHMTEEEINEIIDTRKELLTRNNLIRNAELQSAITQLKIEKEITALRAKQQTKGLSTALNRSIQDVGFSIANPFDTDESAMLQLRIDQVRRMEDAQSALKDQIAIQQELQKSEDVGVRDAATLQIQQLEKRIALNAQLLPQLDELEQKELKQQQVLEKILPAADALTDSVFSLVDGTKTAEQAFADFLRSIASMLADTAKKMIAQYIAIGIARMFAGLPQMSSGQTVDITAVDAGTVNSLGGLNFGGYMANGGQTAPGNAYMVGERGPELFVPGAKGNIVPNNAMGGSNIVVNVDASGSSVEGNSDQAAQLGKMLGAAVQAELVKQKRPGGLLAS
ncbi:tape measure protein [uncultured Mediterranean phage uvMED]|nr:tape measure protein [uncultured Mediterranean phage uvMED]